MSGSLVTVKVVFTLTVPVFHSEADKAMDEAEKLMHGAVKGITQEFHCCGADNVVLGSLEAHEVEARL